MTRLASDHRLQRTRFRARAEAIMQNRSGYGNNHAGKRYSGGNRQGFAAHILASMVMDEGRGGQRRIVESRLGVSPECIPDSMRRRVAK
jgi:hypothetical protein